MCVGGSCLLSPPPLGGGSNAMDGDLLEPAAIEVSNSVPDRQCYVCCDADFVYQTKELLL